MKKSVLILLLVILSCSIQAAVKSTDTFIIIGNETYYCDKVQPGKAYTRIYIDGKQYLKVPTAIVKAYAQSNKFYEYLPVMNTEKDTTGWAFMQLIASHDGYRLYQFCSNCLKYDPVNGIIDPPVPVYRYYIFRQGEFVSVTDDTELQAQLSGFGVKVMV